VSLRLTIKDPMTTASAIDRLVHHSVIVELNVPSFSMEAAKRCKQGQVRATAADRE